MISQSLYYLEKYTLSFVLDIYLFNLHVYFNETCCLDLQYIYV